MFGVHTEPGVALGVCKQTPAAHWFCFGEAKAKTGALAQLGEHLLCKQGVIGSIPIRSTIEIRSAARGQNAPVERFEGRNARRAFIRPFLG